MSVGILGASIILDEPTKIHCGSREPVQGRINIRYQRGPGNPNAELFGPLRVIVVLHGRAKTKIWKSNGKSTSIYRGRAPLIHCEQEIYHDSFRAQPGQMESFPFSLIFPEATQSLLRDDFKEDPRFNTLPCQPLPPSFRSNYHGFAHRYESFVEYRVGVNIEMPQLRVDVNKPTEDQEPIVHYEPPRIPVDQSRSHITTWSGFAAVRNELLLPESDRPSGFRQKTKALLGAVDYPIYSFDWECSAPTHIHLGQPVCFEVRIKPRADQCTAPLIPDVYLKYFRMEISAFTQVRADRSIFTCPQSEGNYTVCEMMGMIDSRQPFSKANDNTKFVNTEAIGTGRLGAFASSFTTFNIAQTYTTKISFAFELTDKVRHIDKEYPILVHPPLEVARHPPPAVAGPSSQPAGEESKNADLPQYEPAPPYEKMPTSTE
ncbi:hypothetical protein F5B22DRAFT_453685 [Xylaria bambusicola]|uniref:uncharacterized protein n=1 Tax=Xylaria bambusicola TaxID=326684 RepID=UPI0020083332|nr:uncharacterized protein F5B22DRAFT_453685 [Xylaria bambusicola]KAI0506415.1 hypothetical protein F5B22DRAFT_453685 [Xylaria bambusicola]